MLVKYRRTHQNLKSTAGELFVEDKWICAALEDAWHMVKLPGITRIPPGMYPLALRTDGGMSPKYAKRFPDFHKGMLWIRNVPEFEFIYFHIGNHPDDTTGCILVGMEIEHPKAPDLPYTLKASEKAYREFYPMVADALARKEKAWLQIINPPSAK